MTAGGPASFTANGGGLTFNMSAVVAGNISILADSGPINLLEKCAGGLMYLNGNLYLGSKAGTPITTSSSDIFMEYKTFNFTLSSFSDSFGQSINNAWFNWNQNGQTMKNVTFGNERLI